MAIKWLFYRKVITENFCGEVSLMEQDTIENVSLPIKLFKKVISLNWLRTIFFCKIITYQGRLLITFFHPSKFFKYFMYTLCRLYRCTFFTTTILSQDIAGRCHFCDYHSSHLRLEPRPSFFIQIQLHTPVCCKASSTENLTF